MGISFSSDGWGDVGTMSPRSVFLLVGAATIGCSIVTIVGNRWFITNLLKRDVNNLGPRAYNPFTKYDGHPSNEQLRKGFNRKYRKTFSGKGDERVFPRLRYGEPDVPDLLGNTCLGWVDFCPVFYFKKKQKNMTVPL